MKDSLVIAVDFDGTCVRHEFPEVGEDVPMAVEVLKKIIHNGHRLILFTMRSDRFEMGSPETPNIKDVTGTFLKDAVEWFKERDIPLYGIQTNPTQSNWTTSPKAYADIYIDDAALGCPLVYPVPFRDDPLEHLQAVKPLRPFVDWQTIERYLIYQGVIR